MHFLVKNNIFDNLSTIFYRWGIKLKLFLDDSYFIIIFVRVCQNIFFQEFISWNSIDLCEILLLYYIYIYKKFL